MAKTKEELDELKKDYESLSIKLKELSEAELKEVCGSGINIWDVAPIKKDIFDLDK